jgi:hypothetical protein
VRAAVGLLPFKVRYEALSFVRRIKIDAQVSIPGRNVTVVTPTAVIAILRNDSANDPQFMPCVAPVRSTIPKGVWDAGKLRLIGEAEEGLVSGVGDSKGVSGTKNDP